MLTQLLHLCLLPPALQCWLGLAALWLGWRGRRWLATMLALTAIVSLYLLSTPMGAAWLSRPLEARVLPLTDLTQLKSAGYQAIVVLGGGRYPHAPEQQGADIPNTMDLMRLRYAARLERLSGLPVLVSGGVALSGQRPEAEFMAESLRDDFGVPVRWLESRSRTTGENARMTEDILAPAGIRNIVLVSHASHLPRAVALFERAGFHVLPAPLGFTTEADACTVVECWTPQSDSLGESRRALHEWLGLVRDSLPGLGAD